MVSSMINSSPPKPRDPTPWLSYSTRNRPASDIKSFYKYFSIPGIGQLAGGLPNKDYFPFDTLEAIVALPDRWQPTHNDSINGSGHLNTKARPSSNPASSSSSSHILVPKDSHAASREQQIDLATALQYGTAEGYPPLHSFVQDFTRNHMHSVHPYQGGPETILTCGATDGFSKFLQAFNNEWVPGRQPIEQKEGLLVEEFAYMNAIQAATPRGMNIVPVGMDKEGMRAEGPGGLREVLESWNVSKGKRPHLMYTVTIGQNPTSSVLSLSRRKAIYQICHEFDIVICVDDPYWYLQYPSSTSISTQQTTNQDPFLSTLVPCYTAIDTDGRVVRLDTFSKTIAPGTRLGWITAQPRIVERIQRITEVSTQQPSGFVQSLVVELLCGPPTPAKSMINGSGLTNGHAAADDHMTRHNAKSILPLRPSSNRVDSLASDRQSDPKHPEPGHGGGAAGKGYQMDGWIRWLSGLRRQYERRMNTMSNILEQGAHHISLKEPVHPTYYASTPDPEGTFSDGPVEAFTSITRSKMYSFEKPAGGMFLWLHVHFPSHPLYNHPFSLQQLSRALWILWTRPEFRVLVAPGTMFGATPEVKQSKAWEFFRICFAACEEGDLESLSGRVAKGVGEFWGLDREEVEGLLEDEEDMGMCDHKLMGMGIC